MATRMQQRRGTAQLWTEVNPVLSAGEIGYETDTGRFKIGDDVNVWEDLPYFLNIDDINNGGELQEYLLSEELGVSIAQLVDGKVPASQLDLSDYAKTDDVIVPLDSRVGTLEQLKQDKVTGVSDSEIATLSDINTSTTVQAQLDLKAEASALDGKANASHTHQASDIEGLSASVAELNILDGATLTTTELNYVDGVTSAIQTQLDSKAASSHTHVLADVTDVTASSSELNILDGATVSTAELNVLDGATISTAELNYLDGVTSAVQTQLDGKAASSHTHTLSDVTDVTATATEINYLSGVDSNVQDQIDGKAASSHTHTISAITDITVDAAAINSLDGVQGNIQDQLDNKSDVDHTHFLSDAVDVTASFTEVNRLVGVTSNVQDQIDSKQDEITGAASTITVSNLVEDRALISNVSGKVAVSNVSASELGHLSGVTSGIQSQLNGKSANGHTHEIQDISGLIDVTPTEINFLGGAFPVTSSIQTQLNGKASTSHVHDISDVTDLQDELDAKLSLSGGTMTGKITLDGDPTQANHAANKAYVDSLSEGLHVHASAVAATTTNINLSTDLEDGDVLDGITLATGNRVLVKNQTNAAQNGIYVVQASGAALRAEDFDSPAEVDGGDFIFVNSGTVNGDTGWVQVTDTITTIGTDPITFTQFSGAGTVKAGTNIVVDGYEVSTVSNPTFSDLTVNTNLTLGASGTLTGISLDKLSDVNVSSAGMGDTIVHNGTEFVNIHVDSVPVRIKQASITSNAYTLSPTADVGRVVEVFSSSPTTILIPENDTFHVGTMVVIMQTGSGQVTVGTAGALTTLNSTPGSKLRAQWSVGTLLKRSEGVWLLYGDLVA